MKKASCGGLLARNQKSASRHRAWLGLGKDYTCSSQELAPVSHKSPVALCPWHLAQPGASPASLPGASPSWILCSLCQDLVLVFGQPGFPLCWDTGDRNSNRLEALGALSVSQTGEEAMEGDFQAGLKWILVALPGPLSLTPLRSSQAIVTSQSSREDTELWLKAFWGIAKP